MVTGCAKDLKDCWPQEGLEVSRRWRHSESAWDEVDEMGDDFRMVVRIVSDG